MGNAVNGILRQVLGIEGCEIINVEQSEGNALLVHVETPRPMIRCPYCGGANVTMRGKTRRVLKTTPYGETPVRIVAHSHRMHCKDCGRTPQEQFAFCAPRKRHTTLLRRQAARDAGSMTIQDAALRNGLRWHAVRDELREESAAYRQGVDLRGVRRIAIDEVWVKRRTFITVVMDLDTKRVLHAGMGRGGEALTGFWAAVEAQVAPIETVSIDMSGAYISSIQRHCPWAQIVFDRFHLSKLCGQALDELRKAQWRKVKAQPMAERRWVTSIQYPLLRNRERNPLTAKERRKLKQLFAHHPTIHQAYEANSAFREISKQPTVALAEEAFDRWLEMAKGVKADCYQKLVRAMVRYRAGIVAYCKHRVSSGPLEGLNNKIRKLLHMAYGYRDMDFLMLRIMSINRGKYG